MAVNIPPAPPAGKDDMYIEMQRLSDDSARVKRAHFIAAQHKRRKSMVIGVVVIIINVLIGSGLIEAVIKTETTVTTVIKAFSFLAASLAAIQTFFNFEKEVECHKNAGDVYSSIHRRLGTVMAQYSGNPANRPDLVNQYIALRDEYLKANDDSTPCVPTDSDFKKAQIKKRGGR